MKEFSGVELKQHIADKHNLNIAEFARSEGLHYTQAKRFVDAGALWINSEIWVRPTKKDKDK
jgi:hypothetical protein